VAVAPDDGLKRGDTVIVEGYGIRSFTGKILSMGAKSVRVSVPPEIDPRGYYGKKGAQYPRRYVKKVQ
jgi:hypothetical protein